MTTNHVCDFDCEIDEFITKNGVIMTPGPLQGEAYYVPHYWTIAMNGFTETVYDGDDPIDIVRFDDLDPMMFPELAGWYAIAMMRSDAGFLHTRLLSEGDYARLLEECEASFDDDE